MAEVAHLNFRNWCCAAVMTIGVLMLQNSAGATGDSAEKATIGEPALIEKGETPPVHEQESEPDESAPGHSPEIHWSHDEAQESPDTSMEEREEIVRERILEKIKIEKIEESRGLIGEDTEESSLLPLITGDLEEEEKAHTLLFVRELMKIESGYNDSNPVWSPDGQMIAFERSTGDKKEIIIAQHNGQIVERVYFQPSGRNGEMDFFFPGILEEISYNSGISWSPSGDRFVFMSNGGGGNYDLYLRSLGRDATTRLTEHKEKDGHAQWSPAGDQLVFVSGRDGKGGLYLMDITTGHVSRLADGSKTYLYPQWSPDAKRITVIYGSNENHDIYIIDDVTAPRKSLRALTTWRYDDLRPTWSPDGTMIAFYSNYNADDDPKVWSLFVIPADGQANAEEDELATRVVATDVIPDVERGPAWMPDSRRIIYVKNDRQAFNPIYMVDTVEKTDLPVETNTKMNHDVVCSSDGTIAFRAQVKQWDHIYIAKLKE